MADTYTGTCEVCGIPEADLIMGLCEECALEKGKRPGGIKGGEMNKENEKTEVVKTEETMPVVQKSPVVEMTQMLLSKDVKPEDLEKMLVIYERDQANQARKAYHEAMSKVHCKIAPVVATHANTQTNSVYADLKDIILAVQPAYSSEGFSVSFDEGDGAPEGHVRILAYVTHSLGHKETYKYDMPLDGKGLRGNANMTLIHGKASSMSYGRRYLQCMIFNIPTGDDDGNAAGAAVEECIDDAQLGQIKDYVDNFKEFDKAKFLEYMKVESLEAMPKSTFSRAMIALESKKKMEDRA